MNTLCNHDLENFTYQEVDLSLLSARCWDLFPSSLLSHADSGCSVGSVSVSVRVTTTRCSCKALGSAQAHVGWG